MISFNFNEYNLYFMMKNLFNSAIFLFLFLRSFNCFEYSSEGYMLIGYNDVNNLMDEMKASMLNESIFQIKDVFETYPTIPKVTCPSDPAFTKLCKSYLIEVANFDQGQAFVDKLPTVLIIAGFHGDEVTGTNAVYQFLKMINKYYEKSTEMFAMLQNVRLLVLPIANVSGFDRKEREEFIRGKRFDPNRDFPYNNDPATKCFNTSTAMIIDTIFRDNMIVGSLTFHGGDNSITYPWGNYAHASQPKTGDHYAFAQVAQVLQSVSADNPDLGIEKYNIGLLQDVVYDVYGGFEDWAYGASWDKKFVSNTCAANVAFSPLVSNRKIEYSDQSNRAFIFLVEAGGDKTPKRKTLGNELAIFDPYNENAVWGNVTRNIALLMRFTEIVQPYVYVRDIQYSEILMIDMAIRGCVTVDDLEVADFENEIMNKKYDPRTNEHNMIVALKNVPKYIPEVTINFQCDKAWSKTTENLLPETHLVKMRTNPEYQSRNGNYSLQSQTMFNTKILNIRTTALADKIMHLQPNNMFSMAYQTTYKAKLLDHYMLFTYNNGHLTVKSDMGRKMFYEVFVYKYGTVGCCHGKTNSGKPYLTIKSGESIEMSPQVFLELLGREVEFRDLHVASRKHKSFIELLNGDVYSLLLLPPNGLTCSTGDFKNYFYVTIKEHGRKQIRIEVLTGYTGGMSFSLEKMQDTLYHDSTFQSKEPNVTNHFALLDIKNTNDLRIRGSSFSLLDNKGNLIFGCTLKMLNPNYSEVDNLNFEAMKISGVVASLKPTQVIDTSLITMLIIMFLLILAIIYYLHKRKQKEMAKEENLEVSLDMQDAKNKDASVI